MSRESEGKTAKRKRYKEESWNREDLAGGHYKANQFGIGGPLQNRDGCFGRTTASKAGHASLKSNLPQKVGTVQAEFDIRRVTV